LIDAGTQQVTVVVAVALRAEPRVDGNEVMEARWFSAPDLPRNLVRGTYESLQLVGAVEPPRVR
jgi:hypothetical protein